MYNIPLKTFKKTMWNWQLTMQLGWTMRKELSNTVIKWNVREWKLFHSNSSNSFYVENIIFELILYLNQIRINSNVKLTICTRKRLHALHRMSPALFCCMSVPAVCWPFVPLFWRPTANSLSQTLSRTGKEQYFWATLQARWFPSF